MVKRGVSDAWMDGGMGVEGSLRLDLEERVILVGVGHDAWGILELPGHASSSLIATVPCVGIFTDLASSRSKDDFGLAPYRSHYYIIG